METARLSETAICGVVHTETIEVCAPGPSQMVNQDIDEARAKLAAWDTDKTRESTVEEVYVKLNCTEEHVKTSKTLDFGWRTLEPQDAVALGEILAKAEVCVNLK